MEYECLEDDKIRLSHPNGLNNSMCHFSLETVTTGLLNLKENGFIVVDPLTSKWLSLDENTISQLLKYKLNKIPLEAACSLDLRRRQVPMEKCLDQKTKVKMTSIFKPYINRTIQYLRLVEKYSQNVLNEGIPGFDELILEQQQLLRDSNLLFSYVNFFDLKTEKKIQKTKKPKVANSELFSDKETAEQCPHIDYYEGDEIGMEILIRQPDSKEKFKNYWAFSCIFALQDKTSVIIYPKSHNKLWDWLDDEDVDLDNRVHLVLNKGDMLIFRTTLIHNGASFTCDNIRGHFYIDSKKLNRINNGVIPIFQSVS